jgi:uncharacterized protein YjbI with pentapeptide repeats
MSLNLEGSCFETLNLEGPCFETLNLEGSCFETLNLEGSCFETSSCACSGHAGHRSRLVRPPSIAGVTPWSG